MSSQFNDPDQWYSDYDAASAKQRHQMLLKAIETSLSSEFIQKADLGGLLLEMRDELVNNNLIVEAISLITRLQQYQPELYSQEYPYFDKFLIQYYLYTSDLEGVKASLVRFEENPSKGIDEMLQVLDFLKFSNATEIATNLCQKTYQLIKNSPDVIGGTEAELWEIILINLMENYR